jgi:Mg-chelatase subunit ChlD
MTMVSKARKSHGNHVFTKKGNGSGAAEPPNSGVSAIEYDVDFDRAFYAHFFQMQKVKERLKASYGVARIRKFAAPLPPNKPVDAQKSDAKAEAAQDAEAASQSSIRRTRRKTAQSSAAPAASAPSAAAALAVADPATLQSPSTADEYEYFMNVCLNSCYDGQGMAQLGRPNLQLLLALDISGSMGSHFRGGDENHGGGSKSKLAVAVECIIALMSHLRPADMLGVVVFCHDAQVLHPLTAWSAVDQARLQSDLRALRPNGGTDLSTALNLATTQFQHAPEITADTSKRIYFLTDLEADGAQFISVTQKNASNSLWMSIVGIDVSLDSHIIEQASAIAGCNYSNVLSEEGFVNILNSEFEASVTPVAFDIRVQVEDLSGSGWTLGRAYGMAELNGMKVGGPAVISSLFPCVCNDKGEGRGAATLFKIVRDPTHKPGTAPVPAAAAASSVSNKKKKRPHEASAASNAAAAVDAVPPPVDPRLRVTCSYRDCNGIRHTESQEVKWNFPAQPEAMEDVGAAAAAPSAALLSQLLAAPLNLPLWRAASSAAAASAAAAAAAPSGLPVHPLFSKRQANFSDGAVRKALLLVEYVEFCGRYLALRELPGQLPAAHRNLLQFRDHFQVEASLLEDRSLEEEVKIMTKWAEMDRPLAEAEAAAKKVPAEALLAAAASEYGSSASSSAALPVPAGPASSAASNGVRAPDAPAITTPCTVCLDESRPKNIVLLPCRHLCLCEHCAQVMPVTCPLCRGQVKESVKLFV